MISYQVSIGFVIITILLCAGTLDIVTAQDKRFGLFGGGASSEDRYHVRREQNTHGGKYGRTQCYPPGASAERGPDR